MPGQGRPGPRAVWMWSPEPPIGATVPGRSRPVDGPVPVPSGRSGTLVPSGRPRGRRPPRRPPGGPRVTSDVHATVDQQLRRTRQRYTGGRRQLVELLATADRPVTIPELVDLGARAVAELAVPQPRHARAGGAVRRIDLDRRHRPLRARRGAVRAPPPPGVLAVRRHRGHRPARRRSRRRCTRRSTSRAARPGLRASTPTTSNWSAPAAPAADPAPAGPRRSGADAGAPRAAGADAVADLARRRGPGRSRRRPARRWSGPSPWPRGS